MTAKQALNISKENDLDQIQLNEVLNKIEKYAKKGKCYTFWDNLNDENLHALIGLGYVIDLISLKDSVVSLKISWKNAK